MSKQKLYVKVSCDTCNGTGYVMLGKLGALRKKAGLSQEDVAERMGLTRTSLSNIENGRQTITLDKVKPMAELYGVEEHEMYDIASQLIRSTS